MYKLRRRDFCSTEWARVQKEQNPQIKNGCDTMGNILLHFLLRLE